MSSNHVQKNHIEQMTSTMFCYDSISGGVQECDWKGVPTLPAIEDAVPVGGDDRGSCGKGGRGHHPTHGQLYPKQQRDIGS